jgi:uncharacterized protein YgbK (DUF1537 family)
MPAAAGRPGDARHHSTPAEPGLPAETAHVRRQPAAAPAQAAPRLTALAVAVSMAAAMQVGVQADDLTGACDTGAVFAARGLPTVVLLPGAPLPTPAPDILVLDTESRGRPAPEAGARARSAAARLAGARPARLYKKVDSTLRGALAAETAGALAGAGLRSTVLAPALPAQRRTVVDGLLRVDGQPAAATAVARDPGFPPTGDSVLALPGQVGPHPVTLVPLATVRRGPAAVAARLVRVEASAVCDAETDADLAVVAAATEGLPTLLAGSAGLATALAARLSGGALPPFRHPRPPLLIVAGSAHPLTRLQVARLRARGGRALTPPGPDLRPDGERAALVRELAEAARREVERATPGTLLLTGGETAYSVGRVLAADGVALDGEVEPGLAIGRLLGGPFAGLLVITKAGGFGDPETLVRVYEAAT